MNAIVFMPGYKASKLMDKNNQKIIFANWKNLLFNYSLGLDILKTTDTLVHAGVLDELSISFIKIDIYKSFINKISNIEGDFTLLNFDYDWRLDIMNHLTKLDTFIKEIKDRFTNIYFICHSLGAYILAYYLKYGTQEPDKAREQWYAPRQLNKIIFFSAPFKGTVVLFKDLYYNDGFLWNKQIFHKNISRTFPAVYQLLPQYKNAIVNENGESIDLFDITNWEKNNFVYWGEKWPHPDYAKSYTAFLRAHLTKAKHFHDRIHESKIRVPDNCKILNFVGINQATPKQYIWAKHKNTHKLIIKKNEYLSYAFTKNHDNLGNGDGLILSETANLPEFYKNKHTIECYENCSHANFFKTQEVIDKITGFLKD